LVVLVTALLVAGVLVLGRQQARRMHELAAQEFNAQQLVLARYAAGMLTQNWDFLGRELTSLAYSPALQRPQDGRWAEQFEVVMGAVADRGVSRVELFERASGRGYGLSQGGEAEVRAVAAPPETAGWWADRPPSMGALYLEQKASGSRGQMLRVSSPVFGRAGKPVGAVSFLLDRYAMAAAYTGGIRSGGSGYAWVIDEGGTFLAHPEESFVGQNAARVRMQRAPDISFEKINRIQREAMAAGGEGCASYDSGWHASVVGHIQKLIAYSPVRLRGGNGSELWSVAVVAPVTEAEEAVAGVWLLSLQMQAVVILVIVAGAGYIFVSERRWSGHLQREVGRRTEKLSRSEERYRSLIENADDIIFTVDGEGRYLSINRHGARFLGCDRPERCLGLFLEEHFSAESSQKLRGLIARALEGVEGINVKEGLEIADRRCWFSIHLKSLRTDTPSVLGILRDITQHRQSEELMYRTEKLASIGLLAAGVAHEINNPLGAIMGFSALLREKAAPGSQEAHDLAIIHEQGQRCKTIVEGLLKFGRVAETDPQAAAGTDVNRDIEVSLAVASSAIAAKRIRVEKDLGSGLPAVAVDAGEMQQIIMNLVNNAVAATGEGGLLRLRSYGDGPDVVAVEVTDNGCGIPEENRKRIYDPFFTTKRVGEGTGLGLSVTYGLVSKYGGTIDCDSRTRDVWGRSGTTFTIRLAANTGQAADRAGGA